MQIKKRIKDYKESLIALNPFSIAFSFISWNLGARFLGKWECVISYSSSKQNHVQ